MRTIKSVIVSFLMVSFIATILHSCDVISSVDLTDQKSVDKLLPVRITKHIDPQATVYEFRLSTTSDFSVGMDIATVEYLLPGSTDVQSSTITIPGNQKPREGRVSPDPLHKKTRTAESGIKLDEIDFSQIASNVQKAKEIMEGMDAKLDGIKFYFMTFDGNPTNTVHRFTTTSKAGTEFGTKHGRAAIVTEYYEFDFTADASGNVTYKE
jgi:hypothetical protein